MLDNILRSTNFDSEQWPIQHGKILSFKGATKGTQWTVTWSSNAVDNPVNISFMFTKTTGISSTD